MHKLCSQYWRQCQARTQFYVFTYSMNAGGCILLHHRFTALLCSQLQVPLCMNILPLHLHAALRLVCTPASVTKMVKGSCWCQSEHTCWSNCISWLPRSQHISTKKICYFIDLMKYPPVTVAKKILLAAVTLVSWLQKKNKKTRPWRCHFSAVGCRCKAMNPPVFATLTPPLLYILAGALPRTRVVFLGVVGLLPP